MLILSIYIISFIYMYNFNNNVFFFFKIFLMLIVFFENFFNVFFLKTSFFYFFFLRLNSESSVIFIFFYFILFFNFFRKLKIILIVLFFDSFFEIKYFSFDKFDGYFENININLENGILLIHPTLLYILYSFIVFLFFKSCLKENKRKYFYFLKKNTKNIIKFINLIMFSIFLGSVWAEQELSWGGFWSWDLIELVLLQYFLISLVYIHNDDKCNCNNYIIYNLLFKLIIFTVFVKYNYINSIHNFLFTNTNLNNFFEFMFLYFLMYVYLYKYNKVHYSCFFNPNYKKINFLKIFFFSINYFIYTLLVYELLNSYTPDFNFFFKNKNFILTHLLLYILLKNSYKINLFQLSLFEYIYIGVFKFFSKKNFFYKNLHILTFLIPIIVSLIFFFFKSVGIPCFIDFNVNDSVLFYKSIYYLDSFSKFELPEFFSKELYSYFNYFYEVYIYDKCIYIITNNQTLFFLYLFVLFSVTIVFFTFRSFYF